MASNETKSYGATRGEIASPAVDAFPKNLKEGTGNSLPTRHNPQQILPSGGGKQIITPADPITKGSVP